MTDPFTSTVQRIEALVAKWEALLDLPGVDVEHRFMPGIGDDTDCVADTSTSWEYRRAQVRWWIGRAVGLDDQALENTVVHEYVHVLIGCIEARLKAGSDPLLEHATENVARSLLSLQHQPGEDEDD